MRLFELEQPSVGDILEIELGDEIVEAVITAIEDGEIIAETDNRQGARLLTESYGRYYCSTDKKWKERKGPKQTRATEATNPAQQAAIAIAKKKKQGVSEGSETEADIDKKIAFHQQGQAAAQYKGSMNKMHAAKIRELQAKKEALKNSVAEGSLNEFAPNGFNGDNGEEFNPRMAKMAYDEGVVKGVSLADGATLEMALKINHWDSHDGGIYKQHFAKGFKAGRMNKVNHDNKQYNLNLKLMKDGSIRHGEQGVAEAHPNSKIYDKCWDGYKKVPGKKRGQAGSCVKEDELNEAEYQGREVKLSKPMQGDVKKFKVYVKDPNTGNVKKVNFGDPNMRIKKSNPKRRKSFRARHNCSNPGPKTKARYWSCRKW